MQTPTLGDRRFAWPLLEAARPRQWPKNVLVLAAPAAAGLLGVASVALRSIEAVGLFLAASIATYLFNDTLDAPNDRLHPVKRTRPVARGALAPSVALTSAVALAAVSVVGAGFVGGLYLGLIIGTYLGISLAYSLRLKTLPVIELGCVASGFVLRAVAGGAAIHVTISYWFLLVTSAGALLVVAGKRSAELQLGYEGLRHRPVLRRYPPAFLRTIRIMAGAVAMMSYALWAFSRAVHLDAGHIDGDDLLFKLSVLPFVLAVLFLELALDSGRGAAPEDLLLSERPLQVLGVVCLALVAAGIYT